MKKSSTARVEEIYNLYEKIVKIAPIKEPITLMMHGFSEDEIPKGWHKSPMRTLRGTRVFCCNPPLYRGLTLFTE